MDGARFHAGTIQTFTGEAFDFANPDPATINLDDIAHALSNACRFAGHTKRFYSVAEHCVRVSEILERWYPDSAEAPKYGLMHDAHEAYVWDCPRPFKPLLGNVYEEFAYKADVAIGRRFDLIPPVFHDDEIKAADDCALIAEARILMHYPPEEWEAWEDCYSKVPAPPQGTFVIPDAVGWRPDLAEEAFHRRAEEVGLCE
jgi:uncharacterized protein